MDALQVLDPAVVTISKTITLGDIGTTIAAFIAIAALFLAWGQIHGLSLQTRASLLLTLDERWEGNDLEDERTALLAFKRGVTEEADRKTETNPETPITAESLFPGRLRELAQNKPDEYVKLFRVCGFFETVAFSVRAGYLKLYDLHALFGVSIRESSLIFERAIVDYQRQYGVFDYFDNYLWLLRELRNLDEIQGLNNK